MTLTIETVEANLAAVFLSDLVVTTNLDRTFVGTLDGQQSTFPSASAPTIGLDTTTIRSDIYRIQVEPDSTLAVEIAANGNFGGTLNQFAFTIAGDNGTTVNGGALNNSGWSVLETSNGSTGTLFQNTYQSGPHDFFYIIVSADSNDTGTYSLSTAETIAALGNDSVLGGANDDTLQGFRGDDLIDGFDGRDTVVYQQNDDVFTLQLGAEISISDRTGNEGTDMLANVEVLDFLDDDFNLSRFSDVASLTQSEFSSFTEMYIAYFNRAPDAAGLMFWANAFATGTSLEEIARLFSTSSEAQALYPPDAGASAFVEAIYTNVLGRASDPDGATFWTNILERGDVTRDEFVLEVLRGARADAPPNATQDFIIQQRADVEYLNNKIDVGIYFSAILGMSDVPNATSVMALYDGTQPSIDAAKAAADEDFQGAMATDGTGEFLIQLVGVIDDPFAIA